MHLVDGEAVVHLARMVDGAHRQRMNGIDLGAGEPFPQVAHMIVVGEEADRAAVHPIDRDAVVHVLVQGLQHEPVAAQRDDGVGFLGRYVAVQLRQGRKRAAGLRHLAGDERDLLELLRYSGHVGSCNSLTLKEGSLK